MWKYVHLSCLQPHLLASSLSHQWLCWYISVFLGALPALVNQLNHWPVCALHHLNMHFHVCAWSNATGGQKKCHRFTEASERNSQKTSGLCWATRRRIISHVTQNEVWLANINYVIFVQPPPAVVQKAANWRISSTSCFSNKSMDHHRQRTRSKQFIVFK